MARSGRPSLSSRERQLLKLAAGGLTDTAISVRLGISEATVKTYWRRIRAKLGRNSRTELVATVLRSEIERTLTQAREESLANREADSGEGNFYKLLLDQAPDAILIVSANGTIQMLNEAAADLFGYTLEELHGEHITTLLPERYWSAHEAHLQNYFTMPSKRAMGDHISTAARLKSGAEIKIAANLSAVGDGASQSVICIVRTLHWQK